MSCYECRIGRAEYFNRPEDGAKTAGGLCRACYERRVKEIGDAEADKLCRKANRVHREDDDDELMRELERDDDAIDALIRETLG